MSYKIASISNIYNIIDEEPFETREEAKTFMEKNNIKGQVVFCDEAFEKRAKTYSLCLYSANNADRCEIFLKNFEQE